MVDTEGKTARDDHDPDTTRPDQVPPGSATQGDEFDRDVNIRAVVWTGAILTGVTALSIVLMWFMFKGMEHYKEAQDPAPSPLEEARQPSPPPGPRLQSTPEEDLATMRHQEDVLLHSYSLIRGEKGYARIPVAEAMDLALKRGLGTGGGMSSNGQAVESPGAPAHSSEPTESP